MIFSDISIFKFQISMVKRYGPSFDPLKNKKKHPHTDMINKWSLLFQKGTQVGYFDFFFYFYFFIAFNSRDMTMLWVLNLCSRSSPTKLWKRIFKKMSQIFFDIQSWHAISFSHIGTMWNVKFESEISMKNFFMFWINKIHKSILPTWKCALFREYGGF